MKLTYSKQVLHQIDKALGYIAARSPQGAANVESRMLTMLALLQTQPLSGRKTRIPGVRRLALAPYLFDSFVGHDEVQHNSIVPGRSFMPSSRPSRCSRNHKDE